MSDPIPTMPSSADAAGTSPVPVMHTAADCPKCFTELQSDRDWWRARPAGRLPDADQLGVFGGHPGDGEHLIAGVLGLDEVP